MTEKLVLVGCGKMGGALLGGWLNQGTAPQDIIIVEPNRPAAEIWAAKGIKIIAGPDSIDEPTRPATILFAVKPQIMDDVVPAYARWAEEALYISIAAGKTSAYFENHLGAGAAVARVMPNTPAAVRRGISAIYGNANVTDGQRDRARKLMTAVGEVVLVETEELIDAVTGVSGSGPAYVFLLAECLADAGMAAGLPEPLAHQLARETISGSGELLRLSDEPAGQLRQNVTSPGGTTAAALEILMASDGLAPLINDAVARAIQRSRELAG